MVRVHNDHVSLLMQRRNFYFKFIIYKNSVKKINIPGKFMIKNKQNVSENINSAL